MARENIVKFYEEVRKNENLKKEFEKLKNQVEKGKETKEESLAKKIVSIAKKNGFDFTEKELLNYMEEIKNTLSEEELLNVSGGKMSAKAAGIGLMGTLMLSFATGATMNLISQNTGVTPNQQQEVTLDNENEAAGEEKTDEKLPEGKETTGTTKNKGVNLGKNFLGESAPSGRAVTDESKLGKNLVVKEGETPSLSVDKTSKNEEGSREKVVRAAASAARPTVTQTQETQSVDKRMAAKPETSQENKAESETESEVKVTAVKTTNPLQFWTSYYDLEVTVETNLEEITVNQGLINEIATTHKIKPEVIRSFSIKRTDGKAVVLKLDAGLSAASLSGSTVTVNNALSEAIDAAEEAKDEYDKLDVKVKDLKKKIANLEGMKLIQYYNAIENVDWPSLATEWDLKVTAGPVQIATKEDQKAFLLAIMAHLVNNNGRTDFSFAKLRSVTVNGNLIARYGDEEVKAKDAPDGIATQLRPQPGETDKIGEYKETLEKLEAAEKELEAAKANLKKEQEKHNAKIGAAAKKSGSDAAETPAAKPETKSEGSGKAPAPAESEVAKGEPEKTGTTDDSTELNSRIEKYLSAIEEVSYSSAFINMFTFNSPKNWYITVKMNLNDREDLPKKDDADALKAFLLAVQKKLGKEINFEKLKKVTIQAKINGEKVQQPMIFNDGVKFKNEEKETVPEDPKEEVEEEKKEDEDNTVTEVTGIETKDAFGKTVKVEGYLVKEKTLYLKLNADKGALIDYCMFVKLEKMLEDKEKINSKEIASYEILNDDLDWLEYNNSCKIDKVTKEIKYAVVGDVILVENQLSIGNSDGQYTEDDVKDIGEAILQIYNADHSDPAKEVKFIDASKADGYLTVVAKDLNTSDLTSEGGTLVTTTEDEGKKEVDASRGSEKHKSSTSGITWKGMLLAALLGYATYRGATENKPTVDVLNEMAKPVTGKMDAALGTAIEAIQKNPEIAKVLETTGSALASAGNFVFNGITVTGKSIMYYANLFASSTKEQIGQYYDMFQQGLLKRGPAQDTVSSLLTPEQDTVSSLLTPEMIVYFLNNPDVHCEGDTVKFTAGTCRLPDLKAALKAASLPGLLKSMGLPETPETLESLNPNVLYKIIKAIEGYRTKRVEIPDINLTEEHFLACLSVLGLEVVDKDGNGVSFANESLRKLYGESSVNKQVCKQVFEAQCKEMMRRDFPAEDLNGRNLFELTNCVSYVINASDKDAQKPSATRPLVEFSRTVSVNDLVCTMNDINKCLRIDEIVNASSYQGNTASQPGQENQAKQRKVATALFVKRVNDSVYSALDPSDWVNMMDPARTALFFEYGSLTEDGKKIICDFTGMNMPALLKKINAAGITDGNSVEKVQKLLLIASDPKILPDGRKIDLEEVLPVCKNIFAEYPNVTMAKMATEVFLRLGNQENGKKN